MNLTLDEIQNFKGKYPKQIWSLFFSEMWERFCFYGMRGMLVFFMISQLNFHEKEANLQYGATQAFVYAFTFVGGLFADKILGFRKSLFWGGLLMIVGSLILATDPHKFFFLGIAFTVVGTGFFKPNISSMVGQLYKPNDSRADAGFSLFYAGINLGALLGGYLCIAIGKGELLSHLIPEGLHWNVAFGLAAIVMVISLVNFIFTQRSLGTIGLQPGHPNHEVKSAPMPKWKEYGVYILSLIFIPIIMKMVSVPEYTDYFMWIVGPLTILYLFYEFSRIDQDLYKNPFSLKGRLSREKYILNSLLILVIYLSLILYSYYKMNWLYCLPIIPLSWFNIVFQTKRCHDINLNGWYQLIPFFGIYLLLKKGDIGKNDYGTTEITHNKTLDPSIKKLYAALIFILFSIVFWGIYEQSGGSLSIFAAKNLNKDLLGLDPNGVNNSGGAFFIIFLAPLLGLLWIWMNKKKIEPNTIIKFGLGFIFLGLGYYVLFATRLFADLQGVTSLNFFTLALLVITLGELCLSPIGLSIMTKLSTKNLQGMMMGMWFLASAYGQYVAGIIGAGLADAKEGSTNYDALITYTEGYKQLALYAVIAGVVLILISPLIKKLMQEVK
ncbi:oligopeptide:H+ symporter [Chryseobacterium sp. Ch-15]|uniref:MFS transporter n=1 Tax=Chryseobacterium muglaense TaxID=2893752 RepID=A0A9Q3UVT3_9FLAO|nr:oligopeptide:H+ symporter [Chryseobacterium muglaense]MBD3904848.1 MFS transporter [Chryseobacterium muglaense]MCC9034396.1 oligopeptide:H+ symporter [Chryseobacterium muglaense]MCM2554503.1 oligopeptide:H+ symporter [Chryseobacterium muglaense]